MKLLHSAGVTLIAASMLTSTASGLRAQSASDLPDGKGKEEVVAMCSGCHGLKGVVKMRTTKKGWARLVDDMIGRGAEGTDEQATLVVNYLAVHFGKPINVNKATMQELREGLSLSAKEAEVLVKYREEKGPFKELSDLLKVPGLDVEKIQEQSPNIVF